MKYFSTLRQRWHHFLHNEELKQKIFSIVFESDTPQGKLFDIILIGSIISVCCLSFWRACTSSPTRPTWC